MYYSGVSGRGVGEILGMNRHGGRGNADLRHHIPARVRRSRCFPKKRRIFRLFSLFSFRLIRLTVRSLDDRRFPAHRPHRLSLHHTTALSKRTLSFILFGSTLTEHTPDAVINVLKQRWPHGSPTIRRSSIVKQKILSFPYTATALQFAQDTEGPIAERRSRPMGSSKGAIDLSIDVIGSGIDLPTWIV